jgi:hypothetical protein
LASLFIPTKTTSADWADRQYHTRSRSLGSAGKGPIESLVRVRDGCAVERRRFPVGASPARQSLQQEAMGGGNEVAEAFDQRVTNCWQREVQDGPE